MKAESTSTLVPLGLEAEDTLWPLHWMVQCKSTENGLGPLGMTHRRSCKDRESSGRPYRPLEVERVDVEGVVVGGERMMSRTVRWTAGVTLSPERGPVSALH